jgi:hypothetical protein
MPRVVDVGPVFEGNIRVNRMESKKRSLNIGRSALSNRFKALSSSHLACALAAGSLASSIFAFSDRANAQTAYNATGQISKVFASHATNYAYRIYLNSDLSQSCSGGFLYVDVSNDNYQVYVSNLMMAYSTGKSVAIEYAIDTNGYCSISEFMVGP